MADDLAVRLPPSPPARDGNGRRAPARKSARPAPPRRATDEAAQSPVPPGDPPSEGRVDLLV